jgi:O-acetyl-ADP-ribose deacetylase (regulator of RNase III)
MDGCLCGHVQMAAAAAIVTDIKSSTTADLIIVVDGDVVSSKLQTIVNTVNCVGVMGTGIAKTFRDRFPEMFRDYKRRCLNKQVKLGEPYVFSTLVQNIVNFPTKHHWSDTSDVKRIEQGLIYLTSKIQTWKIKSLAIPALGCNNGGLDFETIVLPLMIHYLKPLGIPVHIYRPICKK